MQGQRGPFESAPHVSIVRAWQVLEIHLPSCHHGALGAGDISHRYGDCSTARSHKNSRGSRVRSGALVWAVPLEKPQEGGSASYAGTGLPAPEENVHLASPSLPWDLLQGVTAPPSFLGQLQRQPELARPLQRSQNRGPQRGLGWHMAIQEQGSHPRPRTLCLAFLCLPSLSRTHCHLPHLQDPVICGLTAVHFLWLGPRLHLAPIPLTASGVPFRAGNPTGGRETWLCLIWYTPSPGRVRTSKLDPALQNIPQA